MKKLIVLMLLSLCTYNLIYSQTKTEDIYELFKVMKTEETISKLFDNITPLLKQQASMQLKSDEKNAKLESFMNYLFTRIKEITDQLVNKEMLEIYDKHFTHEEIKEYIVFYKTSAGQKMIDKQPEIQADLMKIMMNNYMPEFQKDLMKKLEENQL